MIKSFGNKKPQVAATAYIDDSALVLGEVEVGEDCSIWPMVVLRGDINRISVGDRSNIQDGTVVHVTHAGKFNQEGFATKIGEDVIVGHRAVLHGCKIENHCLIGMGAVVMDGALIKSNVIVGAGSLVPPHRELEGGYLWVGSPVRRVREITEEEYSFLRYSASYYVNLKNQYLNEF